MWTPHKIVRDRPGVHEVLAHRYGGFGNDFSAARLVRKGAAKATAGAKAKPAPKPSARAKAKPKRG